MNDPISANAHRDYMPAAHSSGTRSDSQIELIVMHSTEGGTAASVAHYFQSETSGGSAHLVVDDKQAERCLTNDQVPWGAPGANTQGIHIEQCGYAAWTASEWEQHLPMLHRGAYKAAQTCKRYRIPPRFVDAAGVRAGEKGITTHAEVTLAFPDLAAKYGSHHDPGTGWPRMLFIGLVNHYLTQLEG